MWFVNRMFDFTLWNYDRYVSEHVEVGRRGPPTFHRHTFILDIQKCSFVPKAIPEPMF